MSERLHTIEVRISPPRRDEPVHPDHGEEWIPVRRPHGGIHRFESEHEAREAMRRLETAQPHALFRVGMLDVGTYRRRI